MKRTTIEKPAGEMNMVELAHNCMYAKDRWAWYRDYDSDMDLRDFIRKFSEAEGASELPEDNEALSDILMDNLQYGINDPDGRTALVYRLMWAMADLRETLMEYENTGVNPKEIENLLHKWTPVKKELPETYTSDRLWISIQYPNGYSRTVEGRYDKFKGISIHKALASLDSKIIQTCATSPLTFYALCSSLPSSTNSVHSPSPLSRPFPLFFRCESPRHFMSAWHSYLV